MSARLEIAEIPSRSWRVGTGDHQITITWNQAMVTVRRGGQALAAYEVPRTATDARSASIAVMLAIKEKGIAEPDLGEVDRATRSWALRLNEPQPRGRR